MMSQLLEAEAPPIRRDEDGTLRVGETRVIFDLVVGAFKRGQSPQEIIKSYRSLSLSDAYGAISYYLRHTAEVESYLARREVEAGELRKKIEASQPDMSHLKARIAAARESGMFQ